MLKRVRLNTVANHLTIAMQQWKLFFSGSIAVFLPHPNVNQNKYLHYITDNSQHTFHFSPDHQGATNKP